MTPLAWVDGSLSLRCDDLLYFPEVIPLDFVWKLLSMSFMSRAHSVRTAMQSTLFARTFNIRQWSKTSNYSFWHQSGCMSPRENVESKAGRQTNSRLPAGNFPLASLFQFSKKRKFGQSPKQNTLLTVCSIILLCALAFRKEILTWVSCTCVYDQLLKQTNHLDCCNYNP